MRIELEKFELYQGKLKIFQCLNLQQGIIEWLVARQMQVTFSGIFFPSKVPEFLLFSRRTFSCIFFAEMLLFCFVNSLCTLRYFVFIFLRHKVQNQPKNTECFYYYLIEKHMQKFRDFWRKKISLKKSLTSILHLSLLNYCQNCVNLWVFLQACCMQIINKI